MKKTGLSEVVSVVLIVGLSLIAIGVVFAVVKNQITNFSPDEDCSSIGVNHIFLRSACYLNDSEILVRVERDLTQMNFDSLDFVFSNPSQMEFILKGGNCLDIREFSSEYGRECKLIGAGQKKEYVFFVGDEKADRVSLGIISGNSEPCMINQINVKEEC